MERLLKQPILQDVSRKIILLSGPRQAGKTTFARALLSNSDYLNFDVPEQREAIRLRNWRRDSSLLVLDELHKMPKWKGWLKGIYDGEGLRPPLLITGSAKLDVAKKVGDSLAGRYFSFRMHPFTLKELVSIAPEKASLEKLLNDGGFPEPYLSTETDYPARWRRTHLEIILRQDLIDLEQVRQITQLETLVQLLRSRVGSTVSFQRLSEDLQVDQSTIKRWLLILENLYIVFRLTPWHRNVARSILKAAKFYFYDTGQILGDNRARFENLVACALLREAHWEQDVRGREINLHYLRNKDGDEIDFCVTEKNQVTHMIEAKWEDDHPSKAFKTLCPKNTKPKAIQLVRTKTETRDYPFGVRVISAEDLLSSISL